VQVPAFRDAAVTVGKEGSEEGASAMKCLMCPNDVESDLEPIGLMFFCTDEEACVDRARKVTGLALAAKDGAQ
jgi:hypothetical protein